MPIHSEESISHENMGHHLRRGGQAVIMRQLFTQLLGTATTLVMARWLSPAQFGLYGTLVLYIQFLSIFMDTGLGLALIRQKEQPTDHQYAMVFSFQLVVLTVVCGTAALIAPFVIRFLPHMKREYLGLIWTMLGTSWLGAFRLLPNLSLERKLAFPQLAMIDVGENFAFNICAIGGVVLGWGLWALIIASLLRAVVGMILALSITRFIFKWTWNWSGISKIIGVGIGFQSLQISSFLKDLIVPTFLLAVLGQTQFGYFIWGRDIFSKLVTPSRLYSKIALPALTKVEGQEKLASSIRVSSTLLGLFYWPVLLCGITFSKSYIPLIFGAKWLPAQPVLCFFIMLTWLQIWGGPWMAFVQAFARSRWFIRMILQVTAVELATGILLVHFFGIVGAGITLVVSTCVYMIFLGSQLRNYLGNFFWEAVPPWQIKLLLSTVVVGIFNFLLPVQGYPLLLMTAVASCLFFWFAQDEDRTFLFRHVLKLPKW